MNQDRLPPKHLEADQRGVFRRLDQLLHAPGADGRYDRLKEASNGRIISADVARLLVPEFQSWEGRLRHTPATGQPAGAYAHQRVLRALAQPVAVRRLLVTAGGAGSGKTTLLSERSRAFSLTFDNQFKDEARAREVLDQALVHCWKVLVVYVHRPWRDVVRAVIERSQRTGRWNALAELPRMHIEAQRTILKLRKAYQDRVVFHAVYNASEGRGGQPRGSRVPFVDLSAGGRYHRSDAQRLARAIPQVVQETLAQHVVCGEVASLITKGI